MEMVNNEEVWQTLQVQFIFIAAHAKTLVRAIKIFESDLGQAMFIFREIESLIREFHKVPIGELTLYRMKSREFSTVATDIVGQLQAVLDFWVANSDVLPKLSKLAFKYAFLMVTSASAERSFSYYNKLLTTDRRSLKEDTISKLLMLYFNV